MIAFDFLGFYRYEALVHGFYPKSLDQSVFSQF
jgi:hypothetical protein